MRVPSPSWLPLCAAAALLASTCSGLSSGTCGDEGKACCDGRGCATGLVCGAQDTCVPCGDLFEACCAADACTGALECRSGTCADAACPDACPTGERRCSTGGGVELCTQSGRCTGWTAVVASCPTGFECRASGTDAQCVERCPGACTVGALLCAATGLKKCAVNTVTGCPALEPFADEPLAPLCLAGACDGTWCWESPRPQGETVVALDGWAADQFWMLDTWGNILRRDGNGWAYEHRAQPLKTVRALTSCGASAGLMLAVGDNGTVLRRVTGGTWVPEDLGDNQAQLKAVACTSFLRSFAVGGGGKAFVRDEASGGTWRALTTGTNAELRGAAYQYFTGTGVAVGAGGVIVRCLDLNVPASATCTFEGTGVTTAQLNDVWLHPTDSTGVAVGAGGVVLWRNTGAWARTAQSLTTRDLLAVTRDSATSATYVVVGQDGVVLSGVGTSWQHADPPDAGTLRAVFAPAADVQWAAGDDGALWMSRSSSPTSAGWSPLGGRDPTTGTVQALSGLPPEDVWAVVDDALLRRVSGVWQPEAAGVVQGALFALAAADGGDVYAVGATDGGVALVGRSGRWAAEPTGQTGPLYGVFADDRAVVAVGSGGQWLERRRGAAQAWSPVPHGLTSELLLAVTGAVVQGRAVEVNAVGATCTLLTRFADGGFAGGSVPGCSGDALFAAWQGPDGELLVGGESAFVARRTGGTWVREYLGSTLERVRAVAASGSRSWAVCESGELYVRVNGTWQQEQPRFTARTFLGAWANPGGDVWVSGTSGLVWRGR